MTSVSPNECLYVSNLPQKINKDELKRLLYMLFTQHGRIIDIVIKKSEKMRGQAHVVFQDLTEAISAMRALQSFQLYDKPIKIQFAISKARATVNLAKAEEEYMESRNPKKEPAKDKAEGEPPAKKQKTTICC